jgi:hypothetical protein
VALFCIAPEILAIDDSAAISVIYHRAEPRGTALAASCLGMKTAAGRWQFPGSEDITNLWNGTYTQSGTQVTVDNASYDGSLAPGATATVGFTANGSGSPAPSISCS